MRNCGTMEMWKYTLHAPRYSPKRSASIVASRWPTTSREQCRRVARRSPRGGAYLGVNPVADAFTPSTRLVSIGRGRAIPDRIERSRRAAQVRRPRRLGERYKRSEGVVRRPAGGFAARMRRSRTPRETVLRYECSLLTYSSTRPDWYRNRCSCRLGVAQFHHL